MPVYEYVCGPCQTRFERYVQRFNQAVQCPSCQGSEIEKQLSAFAVGASRGRSPAACEQGPSAACCGGGCGRRPA